MILDIINIIAIIIIPIIAVIIGYCLQNRSEKRKDKMRIFSHLMSIRAFNYIDQYSVNIINSVPIVFYNDKEVIEKYNIYLKSLNIKPEDVPQKQKEIDDNKTNLLVAMAKALGYKNINWELIQNPYVPQGLINEKNNENLFKQWQLDIAKKFSQVPYQNSVNNSIRIKKSKSNQSNKS